MVFEECTFEECAWIWIAELMGQEIANSFSSESIWEEVRLHQMFPGMAFGEDYECWIAELRRQHIANNEMTSR